MTSLATPTRKQFAQARSQGYTKWVPPKRGMSRSTFLKEAASRVYEDKMAQNRPANGYSRMYSTLPFVHPSISADAAIAAKARIAQHAAEIRKLKEDPNYQNVPVSDDRPLSKYSDVLDRLEAISAATHAPPMPKLPGLAARLSRAKSRGDAAILTASIVRPSSPTSTVKSSAVSSKYSVSTGQGNISTAEINPLTGSMKPGASKIKHPFHRKPSEDSVSHSPSKGAGGRFSTLRGHKLLERAKSKKDKKRSAESIARPALPTLIPPSDEKFAVLSEEQVSSRIPVPAHPQVRDPVDLAVEKLVLMGFEEGKAKKVLAQTETGNGINFETALSKLKKEMERRKRLERLETMG